MIMEEMTSREFAAGLERTRTAILPVGSLEEHGSHLPLCTDTMHMEALARAAAERTAVFVAPAISYGLCRSTAYHPGTVSISFDTVRALVADIGQSLYRQGIRRLIVATGHAGGGHQAALVEAGEALKAACPDLVVAVLSVIDLLAGRVADLIKTPGDAHSGELETSIVMHLAPHLVKGTSPREFPNFPAPILVRRPQDFWPGGVWGDPGAASADQGRELIARGVDALVEVIERVKAFEETPTSNP
ncbi:MAG: creatininase family protein [Proteobacteria bacterium]|nr:creatininase family protein [Pseudomonadota bacterium]